MAGEPFWGGSGQAERGGFFGLGGGVWGGSKGKRARGGRGEPVGGMGKKRPEPGSWFGGPGGDRGEGSFALENERGGKKVLRGGKRFLGGPKGGRGKKRGGSGPLFWEWGGGEGGRAPRGRGGAGFPGRGKGGRGPPKG